MTLDYTQAVLLVLTGVLNCRNDPTSNEVSAQSPDDCTLKSKIASWTRHLHKYKTENIISLECNICFSCPQRRTLLVDIERNR